MYLKSVGFFLVSLLLISFGSTKTSPDPKNADQRIIGGKPTTINRVPYVVQVRLGNRFVCGGTLVAKRFVVSAAHCVQGVLPRQLTIVGGATKLSDRGVRRRVQKIVKPKNFNLRSMKMDVAVFKLFKPMSGPNIRTIPLNTQPLKAGMVMKVSGWGSLRENPEVPSNSLMTVNVPIVPKKKCKTQYSRLGLQLTGTMFCAAAPKKDACSGDSGGPAVCNGKLCGIVSFGFGCGRRQFPGVYTGVRSVLKLIRRALKQ